MTKSVINYKEWLKMTKTGRNAKNDTNDQNCQKYSKVPKMTKNDRKLFTTVHRFLLAVLPVFHHFCETNLSHLHWSQEAVAFNQQDRKYGVFQINTMLHPNKYASNRRTIFHVNTWSSIAV